MCCLTNPHIHNHLKELFANAYLSQSATRVEEAMPTQSPCQSGRTGSAVRPPGFRRTQPGIEYQPIHPGSLLVAGKHTCQPGRKEESTQYLRRTVCPSNLSNQLSSMSPVVWQDASGRTGKHLIQTKPQQQWRYSLTHSPPGLTEVAQANRPSQYRPKKPVKA